MDKDRKYAEMEAQNLFNKWYARLNEKGMYLGQVQDLIRVNINEDNVFALETATINYYNAVKEIVSDD